MPADLSFENRIRQLIASGIIISGGEDPPAAPEGSAGSEGNDPPADPNPAPKMVPESDLLAVKERSSKFEARVKELESELSTHQTEASSWQKQYQDAEAQLSTLKEQAESVKTVQSELDALKTKSEGDSKSLEESNKTILDLTRNLVAARYPDLDQAKYKDMSQSELDSLLKALEIVNPAQGSSHRFDSGDGSGSNGAKSALEIAQQELAGLRPKTS